MENGSFGNTGGIRISADESEAALAVLRFMGMTFIEAGASTVPAALLENLHGFSNGVDDCPLGVCMAADCRNGARYGGSGRRSTSYQCTKGGRWAGSSRTRWCTAICRTAVPPEDKD
jgi:hypothetical protein